MSQQSEMLGLSYRTVPENLDAFNNHYKVLTLNFASHGNGKSSLWIMGIITRPFDSLTWENMPIWASSGKVLSSFEIISSDRNLPLSTIFFGRLLII